VVDVEVVKINKFAAVTAREFPRLRFLIRAAAWGHKKSRAI
jgi:hypothetical protein